MKSERELKRMLTLVHALRTNVPCTQDWQEDDEVLHGMESALLFAAADSEQPFVGTIQRIARDIAGVHSHKRNGNPCTCPCCQYAKELPNA